MIKKLNAYNILLVFIVFAMFSCSSEKKYISFYKFGNLTLERVDEGDYVYLYIGNDKNNYIEAHPQGFNGVLTGYIKFHPDFIEVLSIEGSYEQIGEKGILRLRRLLDGDGLKWDRDIDKYNMASSGSLMYFNIYINSELVVNSKIHSKVKAIYDTALLRRSIEVSESPIE